MLTGFLPAPKHHYVVHDDGNSDQPTVEAPSKLNAFVPPYGKRSNFIPVDVSDFGDGGAFPEIHVVQYPLNMGKPGAKSSAVIAVNVDEKGQVQYDAVVKQGANRNKIVQSNIKDLKEKEAEQDKIALPNEKEEQEAADKTRRALEAILEGKIKSSKASTVVHAAEAEEPTYIRYTPDPNAPGYTQTAEQRIIRMVEAQVDPMEPPKHKHKKVPRGPGSPPPPVLHSPPRKLTVADQQAWKIPPCISNWKNARGYTIPLDKRLAADGRGLQEVTINNKFATFSEALYISERKASEDLRVRNQIRKKMAIQEKEDKEKELREMAMRARAERSGVSADELLDRVDEPDSELDKVFQQSTASLGQANIGANISSTSARVESFGGRGGDRPRGARQVDNRPAWLKEKEEAEELAKAQSGGNHGGRHSDDDHDDRRGSRGRSGGGRGARGRDDDDDDDSRGGGRGGRRDARDRSEDRDPDRDRGGRDRNRDRDRRDDSRDRKGSHRENSRERRDDRDRDNRSRPSGDRDRDGGRERGGDRDYDRGGRGVTGDGDQGREEFDRKRDTGRERLHEDEADGSDNEGRAPAGETDAERVARMQREKLRVERRKERERQLRLDNMKGALRKNKIDRDQNRDVSEKIALGMLKGTGQLTGEALFDSRLFNQSAGMDSGFSAEDDYSTYSKPLFDRGGASSIYRPKRDESEMYGDVDAQMAKLSDTSKFRPDKGFAGAGGDSGAGGGREAPVQFEKARGKEEDPFGIDEIVSKSKRARRDD